MGDPRRKKNYRRRVKSLELPPKITDIHSAWRKKTIRIRKHYPPHHKVEAPRAKDRDWAFFLLKTNPEVISDDKNCLPISTKADFSPHYSLNATGVQQIKFSSIPRAIRYTNFTSALFGLESRAARLI